MEIPGIEMSAGVKLEQGIDLSSGVHLHGHHIAPGAHIFQTKIKKIYFPYKGTI